MNATVDKLITLQEARNNPSLALFVEDKSLMQDIDPRIALNHLIAHIEHMSGEDILSGTWCIMQHESGVRFLAVFPKNEEPTKQWILMGLQATVCLYEALKLANPLWTPLCEKLQQLYGAEFGDNAAQSLVA